MAKRRYRVKRGQTYLDIASATGVDLGALLSVNAATPTPVGGFNVNIPTAPNTVGAPPPQNTGGGKAQYSPIAAPPVPPYVGPGYGMGPYSGIQQYNSLQTSVATGPTATPGFTSTGYYASPLSPSTTQTYGQPVYDAQGNVIAASGGTVTPQPIGGTEGSGVGVSTAPNNIYGVDAYGNATPKVLTEEERLANGATVTQMQASGYTYDNNTRTWVLTTAAPAPAPQRNTGGWMQSSDGSWHLNRNASQTRKKEERAANRKKANQSSTGTPVNWSI